jgi:hypothetical protein
MPLTIFVANDLKVFRSTIAMLADACERTLSGYVELRIDTNEMQDHLIVECEATSEDITTDVCERLVSAAFRRANGCMKYDENNNPDAVGDSSFCALEAAFFPGLDKSDEDVPFSTSCERSLEKSLELVAAYMQDLNGSYGVQPRSSDDDTDDAPQTGTVFSFSIPIAVPM